jgi:hypothetical protein
LRRSLYPPSTFRAGSAGYTFLGDIQTYLDFVYAKATQDRLAALLSGGADAAIL